MTRIIAAGLLCLSLVCCSGNPGNEQSNREQEFTRKMTDVTLAGRFSSQRSDKIASDKYTISKVSKVTGDLWLIHSRIQYGDHDVTFPVPVRVLWAGDTPVLTLTDVGIPGLGTFTSRLLIYQDQYAGTWSSSKGSGGQMFGRIEKNKP